MSSTNAFFFLFRSRTPILVDMAGMALLVLLFFFLPPVFAFALPPQRFVMEPPVVRTANNELLLDLSLTVDNEDGLRDMLKDGAVLRLAIGVTIDRERSWWTNAQVLAKDFISVIRHDPLSRDFVVSLPGDEKEQRQLRDKNLTRLLYASWRNLSLPVLSSAETSSFIPEADYLLHVTFSLQHTDVPPWLEKSFIFWSADVVPPAKLTISEPVPVAVP